MSFAQFLIVASLSIAVLITMLLLSKTPKIEADKFLIAYLCYFLLNQLMYLGETYDYFGNSPLPLYTRGFYLICPPLFYLYLYHLTSFGKKAPKYVYLLFAPFITFSITFLYYYLVGFETFNLTVQHGLIYQNNEPSLIWAFFSFCLLLLDPLCLFLFYRIYRHYTSQLKQKTSNINAVQLKWLNILFLFWLISIVLVIPLYVLTIQGYIFSSSFIQILYQLVNLAFIFVLGWHGLKQKIIYQSPETNNTPTTPYSRSGLSDVQATALHQQLLHYMQVNKPYLKGDLKAGELSEALNISTSHLSQILNQKQGQNFFEFINQYRVMAVQEKMKDSTSQHLTLLALALDSGFNSKTSFNQLFKKITGETPSAYYKKIKEVPTTGSERF